MMIQVSVPTDLRMALGAKDGTRWEMSPALPYLHLPKSNGWNLKIHPGMKRISSQTFNLWVESRSFCGGKNDTVDGRNPVPVEMVLK